jgi:hypothetical protein
MRSVPTVLVAIVVAIALGLPVLAAANVKRVSLTTPVRAGSYASITVLVTPRSRCTIQVIYDTVISKAKGLGRKTGGRIMWRWRVGTNTHPGSWPIIVKCGAAGTLRTRISVQSR